MTEKIPEVYSPKNRRSEPKQEPQMYAIGVEANSYTSGPYSTLKSALDEWPSLVDSRPMFIYKVGNGEPEIMYIWDNKNCVWKRFRSA